jgi:surfactin synthase thioesterase subunit
MNESKLRLIAFQFAGANRHAYRPLQRELACEIELKCFELPGRGRRRAEPLLTDLPSMVADLLAPISACVAGSRYAFFGHSMGSRLALLAAQLLLERGWPAPLRLIVSASPPPSRPISTERYRLSPADFLRELRALGGCPEEMLNDPELLDVFLPVLRADFEALETYRAEARAKLPCPITVLRGVDDREVSRDDAEAWRAETTSSCDVHDFAGGHFFLFQKSRQIAALLENIIGRAEPPM